MDPERTYMSVYYFVGSSASLEIADANSSFRSTNTNNSELALIRDIVSSKNITEIRYKFMLALIVKPYFKVFISVKKTTK
jgi:hypothetical protein